VDWFFDAAAPLETEDQGALAIVLAVEGGGTVGSSPDLPAYECDDTVELTAVPDPGWLFDHWSGDLEGTSNPESLTVVGEMHVTATFVPNPTAVALPGALTGALRVHGAVPNPFDSSTRIVFDLPREGPVDVSIYSVSGRLVRRLLHGELLAPGRRSAVWDGRLDGGAPAPPGLYFCRVETRESSATGRAVRLR
jgi:hypothetical protein